MSKKVKPATASYSRGFVRGEDHYIPGEEITVSYRPTGHRMAFCPVCRNNWRSPPEGLVHPMVNRFGDECMLAGQLLPAGAPTLG